MSAIRTRPTIYVRGRGWVTPADVGCTCPYDYRPLGRLYGISMGKDWLRTSTEPACPHHSGSPS